MKHKTVKTAVLSVLALLVAGFAGTGFAHKAVGTLAASATAVDVYHTTCSDAYRDIPEGDVVGPAGRFSAYVQKLCTTNNAACNAGSGRVRVSIGGSSNGVTSGSNPAAGAAHTNSLTTPGNLDPELVGVWAAGLPTSGVAVKHSVGNGDGDYVFAISHDSAVVTNYLATVHCEKPGLGVLPNPGFAQHTGTGISGGGTFRQITNQ